MPPNVAPNDELMPRALSLAVAGMRLDVAPRRCRRPTLARDAEDPPAAMLPELAAALAAAEAARLAAVAVTAPVVAGFFSVKVLGGLLAGALVSGVLLAIFMSNAGGAWDNAKKQIEGEEKDHANDQGKGSDSHHAAVIGDTVGDPFKDTAGPALNILVKLMTVVALVIAPLIAN